jgi:hypothetical protein
VQTVFSYIVQKRFSQVNEDVATDALAFILASSPGANTGLMKILRSISPELPELTFKVQQGAEGIRPDLCGYAGTEPHVFIENKFWAGLTENQPVNYIRRLQEYPAPTILLVVVPEAREQTVWRELEHRLNNAGITITSQNVPSGLVKVVECLSGPVLALTSWTKILASIELEIGSDVDATANLLQLRSLCNAADNDAFKPMTKEVLTDQRIPALVIQLSSIIEAVGELGVSENVLSKTGLMPQASWERIGRYIRLPKHIYGWFGTNFLLWQKYGISPLWMVFHDSRDLPLEEPSRVLETWAAREGVFAAWENSQFVVAMEIPAGEEKDRVVRSIADQFAGMQKAIAASLG